MQEKPSCEVCIKINRNPQCDECLPELFPENIVPYKLYSQLQGQYIMGFSGAVDINFESVFKIMDLYEIDKKDRKNVFEKIVTVARQMLAESREKRELEKK